MKSISYEEALEKINDMRSKCRTCYQHAIMTETQEYQELKNIILSERRQNDET